MKTREKKMKMFELQYDDLEMNKWITVKYFKTLDIALKGLIIDSWASSGEESQ